MVQTRERNSSFDQHSSQSILGYPSPKSLFFLRSPKRFHQPPLTNHSLLLHTDTEDSFFIPLSLAIRFPSCNGSLPIHWYVLVQSVKFSYWESALIKLTFCHNTPFNISCVLSVGVS
jgi:hypothetical protein